MMFQYLIDENGLMDKLKRYNLNDTDVHFIKEQIAGPLEVDTASNQPDHVRAISNCPCV